MLLYKRLTLVALLLTACLAISSVRCTSEEKGGESSSQAEPVQVEELAIADDSDYESGYDESENELPPKQDYLQQQQPGSYQSGSQPNYIPQQPVYLPPPPPVPLPVPAYLPPPVAPISASYQVIEQPYVPEQQVGGYQPIVSAPVLTNNNYSLSGVPVYQQPEVVYQQPQLQQNYTTTPVYQVPRPVVNKPSYAAPIQQTYQTPLVGSNYTGSGSKIYSIAELLPFVLPIGYRANHWSLFYYRASPYRTCPKNIYLAGPSYKDIEAAFIYAQQQLGVYRNAGILYMNSTQPSFAARHQVFSFLSQQSARMDEEGLLVELVSTYLADRACLTKWDKQRYLPQLTKFVSVSNFPYTHSCSQLYRNQWQSSLKYCAQNKYRTLDGFCNNPYHPYWGKSNVCHIRLLSPDYADGISVPRNSYNPRFPLPNPRLISNLIHNDIPIEGPYNLMKMQWGQFINHDITNTALSSYDGLVDCCKNPNIRGCWPIYVPPGDKFYGLHNVTCLNFIRSGVCPLCQLGPRQQINKNTAFLDASQVYGNTQEVGIQLRTFKGGLLRVSIGKNNEVLLPIATDKSAEQCQGVCYQAGDPRVNQHPMLTVLHTLLLRSHNSHAYALAKRHPNWDDEYLFQEARRITIAEYQMITYSEYLPIVFGPILTAYYKLLPLKYGGYTYFDPKVDPTTWNEYSTASCRFGHSQIANTFSLLTNLIGYGQKDPKQLNLPLKEWFMRPSLLADGLTSQITIGLLYQSAMAVDPWVTNGVRNHLYQSLKEHTGGDLPATNIWRGRDHGIPGYVHYVEYCFNIKVRGWRDLALFIPYYTLNNLRKYYKVVENIDLFTGGVSERHFPGADIGPTFACINGIQYYHLKFGDRFYFEHGNQVGSFTPPQLEEIRRSTLARLLCRTAYIQNVPQYAFLQVSQYNPAVNCSYIGEFNYSYF